MKFGTMIVAMGAALIVVTSVQYAYAGSADCQRVVGKIGQQGHIIDGGCPAVTCDSGDGDCVQINRIGTGFVYCECDESGGNPCVIHVQEGWSGPLPPGMPEHHVVYCEDELCAGTCDPSWSNGQYVCPCI